MMLGGTTLVSAMVLASAPQTQSIHGLVERHPVALNMPIEPPAVATPHTSSGKTVYQIVIPVEVLLPRRFATKADWQYIGRDGRVHIPPSGSVVSRQGQSKATFDTFDMLYYGNMAAGLVGMDPASLATNIATSTVSSTLAATGIGLVIGGIANVGMKQLQVFIRAHRDIYFQEIYESFWGGVVPFGNLWFVPQARKTYCGSYTMYGVSKQRYVSLLSRQNPVQFRIFTDLC